MSPLIRIAAFLCVMLLGMSGGEAYAGFIAADAGGEVELSEPPTQVGGGSSSERPIPQGRIERVLRPGEALLGGSTGSMTASGSSGSPVFASAAMLTESADPAAELQMTLEQEAFVWLPPPFLSGVFRPPRV